MCKHILNAQVTIRYYDGNWYDCPLCFLDENGTYPDMSRIGTEMVFACKVCKKCFRKDMRSSRPDSTACNNYVVEAVTPETIQEERLQKRLKLAAEKKEKEEAEKKEKEEKLNASESSANEDGKLPALVK